MDTRRPTAAPVTEPAAEVRRRVLVEERQQGWAGVFRRPVWAAVSLAAAVAVAALGAWNVQLQGEIAGLTAYRDGVVRVLEEAAQPGSQLAVLNATEGAGPTGLAAIAPDGAVAVVMRDLAPTAGSEVYEVWLIAGEGAPVPVGELRVGADRTATLITSQEPLGTGLTVALTREPGPDSTTPTLPIVAAGVARSEAS